ncbi:putative prolyl-tRNA synthetase [Candidatus Zinderia insecticola CARI]|uniref:Proline--tRNA ligase n=1 Tax=Zinderia insecticola (strain CARI) TaxID=871271 RepID=E0TJ05_ZINIC|nr:putative prolyl-tRNA synthetase [Candidatus Zinderia insecticola CARI]
MLAKKFFIFTLKKILSNINNKTLKIINKIGMIKKISSGIYTYMPILLLILKKIKSIINYEMKKNNITEILMPIIQPSNIWKKTKRWYKMKNELLKFKNRKKKYFVMQPTSEELITYIIKKELLNYKQLPLIFYNIQNKFRDELRCKSGLIRLKEFIMKDAYSFDISFKNSIKNYKLMLNIYKNIFNKINLKFKILKTNNKNMEWIISHEFHIITKNSNNYFLCSNLNSYNINLYNTLLKFLNFKKIKKKKKIKKYIINYKILILKNKYLKKKEIWILLINKKNKINKKKIKNILNNKFKILKKKIINKIKKKKIDIFFLRNKRIKKNILIDNSLYNNKYFIFIYKNKNKLIIKNNIFKNKIKLNIIHNINKKKNKIDLNNFNILKIKKSIEIAHIFLLGKFYSRLINSKYINYNNKKKFFFMGSYGIGISRLLQIIIEKNIDKIGIKWPNNLIPFNLVICFIKNNNYIKKISYFIYYKLLLLNINLIIDNRNINIGYMLNDWELIGIPNYIIVGNFIKKNIISYKVRKKKNIYKNININKIFKFIFNKINIYK